MHLSGCVAIIAFAGKNVDRQRTTMIVQKTCPDGASSTNQSWSWFHEGLSRVRFYLFSLFLFVCLFCFVLCSSLGFLAKTFHEHAFWEINPTVYASLVKLLLIWTALGAGWVKLTYSTWFVTVGHRCFWRLMKKLSFCIHLSLSSRWTRWHGRAGPGFIR
jgi:hypothetical protein